MARIYGWDQSHYDGTLTTTILRKAKAEGIAFVTHKLGEGLTNVDPLATTALAAARSVGFQIIGGYWFIHGNDDPIAEAKRCVAVADQHESWWRDFNGWFWQTDAETSSSGLPSPSYVKKFSDELARLSGRRVIVYASHGMYGNRLEGLGHPLWNANYGSNQHGSFTSVYPGDSSAGWGSYSGQTPALLQYSSNATIAGLTTCDANAFKGTIDQFLTLIGADMPLDAADKAWLLANLGPAVNAKAVFNFDPGTVTNGTVHLNSGIPTPSYRPDAPAQGGTNATCGLGWMLSEINTNAHTAAAATTAPAPAAPAPAATPTTLTEAQVADLHAQIASLQQQNADLQAKLAAVSGPVPPQATSSAG